jgi:predicted tellurium resistance membrane protein TerC
MRNLLVVFLALIIGLFMMAVSLFAVFNNTWDTMEYVSWGLIFLIGAWFLLRGFGVRFSPFFLRKKNN